MGQKGKGQLTGNREQITEFVGDGACDIPRAGNARPYEGWRWPSTPLA